MRLSDFGALFNILYTDKMNIFRYVETKDANGFTNVSKHTEPVYTDVPCRISFSTNDNSQPTAEDVNNVFLQLKIFCSTNQDVKKGDKLVVSKLGNNDQVLATYSGTASLPNQYETHKEIILEQVGEA